MDNEADNSAKSEEDDEEEVEEIEEHPNEDPNDVATNEFEYKLEAHKRKERRYATVSREREGDWRR